MKQSEQSTDSHSPISTKERLGLLGIQPDRLDNSPNILEKPKYPPVFLSRLCGLELSH